MICVDTGKNAFFEKLARVIQLAIPPDFDVEICHNMNDYAARYNDQNHLFVLNWMTYMNDKQIGSRLQNYMVYNTEILPYKAPLNPGYVEFLNQAVAVYDYSQTNVDYRPQSIYLPLKYSPIWDFRPFDVLFYGTHSPMREELMAALSAAGFNVMAHYGFMPDKELITTINQSKLVISTPWKEDWLNDSSRIIPLLSANVPVIAERTGDKEWWDWVDQYPNIHVVERNEIVPTVKRILYKDKFVFPIPEKPWMK